ncbi:hypothetical protein M0802_014800 [Mischocyttarus mexicanus]|nr:hypothetical protein M0802_014957 [Mischocyttarus mexicanus]KAI4477011.1 hypothetical protein M0802_014800 [Mischocyttarus mexicanus]
MYLRYISSSICKRSYTHRRQYIGNCEGCKLLPPAPPPVPPTECCVHFATAAFIDDITPMYYIEMSSRLFDFQ